MGIPFSATKGQLVVVELERGRSRSAVYEIGGVDDRFVIASTGLGGSDGSLSGSASSVGSVRIIRTACSVGSPTSDSSEYKDPSPSLIQFINEIEGISKATGVNMAKTIPRYTHGELVPYNTCTRMVEVACKKPGFSGHLDTYQKCLHRMQQQGNTILHVAELILNEQPSK
ncbi:hypothetical protein COEREDRAFT_5608 [Coemansia reversa NRRL 1564]|uniref:Uncharacterized protein n=1 Tax=Coemansia reversa (strain ATCC 12441 / NRRL 1564) TaxID=763665 RepID=A0A2G5BLB3_COERN|nr:hypothetical protein COEREDRAFT_5608 [Coemansia reversa NRRL 1564]|eukprot:PIA19798.1 hypothetical protein COEREDRAFT_5608 [Coemansia reversa NRRL 1564]